jgi:UDP-N-acetylglucosamine--dolichyl-phosphate N-acetylglucosaminephosphotransferase
MTIFALMNGRIEAALIGVSLSGALLGFLLYNWYPASILPGDSLTYLSGAALFSMMVLGDMEKFGVFIFMPWILEFFLKLRSGFDAHSWGILQRDGTLKPQHAKNYSLTHPFMRRGFNEEEITLSLMLLQCIVVGSGLLLFRFLGI